MEPEKIFVPAKHYAALYAFSAREKDTDIEYIRKDVFIDKACKWLKENIDHYAYNKDFVPIEDFIKSFRKTIEE